MAYAGSSQAFQTLSYVEIVHADFLLGTYGPYDFISGNPPYVAITGLSESERQQHHVQFVNARGRSELVPPFFKQAMRGLAPEDRLVFITAEEYLYVESAHPSTGF